MKGFRSHSLVILCLVAAFASQVAGQASTRNKSNRAAEPFACTRRIEAKEIKFLIDEIKAKNPSLVKRLETNPELRKTQVENLTQLLAFACQAVKDGGLKDPINRGELENIRSETVAAAFDRIINKEGNQTQFAFIGKNRVADFYKINGNEAKFDEFLKVKIAIIKRGDDEAAGRVVTGEERAQAKEFFAKIRISETDSRIKAKTIDPTFWERVSLQVKLQQAQFLSRIFAEALADTTSVSDSEISSYIALHPEFDIESKRSRAKSILTRAKAGEDFSALANEFSDDPGNIGTDGKRNGGLYADVPKGRMIPAFESAALALNPGDVSSELVETAFGYHIIKLEKKVDGAEMKYDVRHILISTGFKDPENPAARETPVKDFVRNKLETQKEREIVGKIVKENSIDVAPMSITEPALKKEPVKQRRKSKRRH